jgi:hypothetical protein
MSGASGGSGADALLGERAGGERGEAGKTPAAAVAEDVYKREVLEKVEEIRRSAEQLHKLASRIYWDLKDVHRAFAVGRMVRSEANWCLLDAFISRALRRAIGIAKDMEDFLEVLREEEVEEWEGELGIEEE